MCFYRVSDTWREGEGGLFFVKGVKIIFTLLMCLHYSWLA